MLENEGTGTGAVQAASASEEELVNQGLQEGQSAVDVTDNGTGGDASTTTEEGDFFATDPYEVPAATPKFHRGAIESIAATDVTESGSRGIRVTFKSDSNGRQYENTIWPPMAFVDNPRITRDELAALPVPEGKKQSPLQRYGATIHNHFGRDILRGKNDKGQPITIKAIGQSAEVDRLLIVAVHAGRTLPAGRYSNFDEYVSQLNNVVAGTPVVFTTREEKNEDPNFSNREKVNGVYGHDFDVTTFKQYQDAAGA